MKKYIFYICVIFSLFSCVPSKSSSSEDISVTMAKELINSKNGLMILDVRTPEEWVDGTLSNALKVNIKDADFESKLALLDKEQPVLVYCKKGGRSAKATLVLEKLGFKEVYNMLGGYDAYKEVD